MRRILVGWRNTAPAKRALTAALPWLAQVEDIIVVSIGSRAEAELSSAEDFLAANGLRHIARCVERRHDMTVGEQLLREARADNADWLVTGAFRYGEVIEWIFGGVTEDLLQATALPIFMQH